LKTFLEARGEQMALLAALIHEEYRQPLFKKSLQKLIDLKKGLFLKKDLSKEEKANVREWRRNYIQASCLPSDFVQDFTKTTTMATTLWQKARLENNFSKFLPVLKKIISLCRKKADYLGYEEHPYDALLDLFEPHMTIQKLSPLFSELKTGLIALVKERRKKPLAKEDFLRQEFPFDEQMKWAHLLVQAHGLDKEALRIDLSSHPFSTSMHPKDVRITSRIQTKLLMSHLFSILHEGGHALYDQNLPEKFFGTPLCEAISMGMHESQSRFWEVFIGKSRPFWLYFYPQLQKSFPSQLKKVSFEDFYKAINIVKPSLIRIEADEMTYSLHIILRYEMEKALIEGSLKPEEIPDAWREKMQNSMGITPPTDKEGALQDIHWSMGAFGYFPSYSLGNLYAAQFFHTFKKENPSWQTSLQEGNFSPIGAWLKAKIHRHGKLYSSDELIQRVTQKPLDVSYYLSYLKEKYKEL
jgi:carboxypeptidase Taq